MTVPERPFWLKGLFFLALYAVAEFIWSAIEADILEVAKAARLEHAGANMLDQRWADVPIRPPVPESAKRGFIQNYDIFLEKGAKREGLLITKAAYGLTDFIVQDQGDLAKVGVTAYGHYIRIWIDAGTGQTQDIRAFVATVNRAKAKFATDIFEIEPNLGYGANGYGQNHGV